VTGRLFVVGDVHGCAAELEVLLRGLPLAPGDTVAFVGDYIDRGPESRPVVSMLLDLRARPGLSWVFLKGNHEDMCLAYLGRRGRWGEAFCANGGSATLESYGIDPRLAGREAAARMPASHLAFLESLELSFRCDPYLVVHAGIRPSVPWAEQDEEDLLWIRDEFIVLPHHLPQTIVFGHTPQRTVLVDLPYKIGIDTGCVYGGTLTCLETPANLLHQVRFGERRVRQSQLPTRRRRRPF
jgi:serine/threonine protein phosphatase 1